MAEISTNKSIRHQQFRATVREILRDATSILGTADRVGKLARAMEQAYEAGAENKGKVEERTDAAGYVRWDAIPRRSQEFLQDIAFRIRSHVSDIRNGILVAIVEGAGATSPRGERAYFSLWRVDSDLLHKIDTDDKRQWASSSISALVRLNIFEPIRIHDCDERFVILTIIGLTTIEKAISEKKIYLFD